MPVTIKCPMCGKTSSGIPDKFRGKFAGCPNCSAEISVDACEVKSTDVEQTGVSLDDQSESLSPTIPGNGAASFLAGGGILVSMGMGGLVGYMVYFPVLQRNEFQKDSSFLICLLIGVVVSAACYLPYMAASVIITLLGDILRELRKS